MSNFILFSTNFSSIATVGGMGAIAAAGFDYYQAYQSKKHQNVATKKGVSLDAYMQQAKVKENKKAAKKARKYGMTPEQYMAKRAHDYNTKMTNRYGPFNGNLPADMVIRKHKHGKKNKKGKKHEISSSSSESDASSGSGGSD